MRTVESLLNYRSYYRDCANVSIEGEGTPTTSAGIERLRQILTGEDSARRKQHGSYAQAANGFLPVVVHAVNEVPKPFPFSSTMLTLSKDDIAQLILLKRDNPLINLIIYGAHAAPLVSSSYLPLPPKYQTNKDANR